MSSKLQKIVREQRHLSIVIKKQEREYIENSLNYDYNNGMIEGINSKITPAHKTLELLENFSVFLPTPFDKELKLIIER